jgi:hypothetical protein
VKTSAEEALDTAYCLALKKLADKTEGDRKAELEWILDYQEAQSQPKHLPSEELSSYVGDYGPRKVVLKGESLFYSRDGGQEFRLLPLRDDLFVLDGLDYFRILFERDDSGTVNAIRGLYLGDRQDLTPKDE